MSFFFIYLIKLSASLLLVFLFYHFVLRKLTFYNHNRWYLLGYTLLSFFIPFINIAVVLEKNNWNSNAVVTWIPVIHTTSATGLSENTDPGFNMWSVVILVIAAGMVIMLVRLLLQLLSYKRMRKKALPVTTEGMNLYQVNENIIPFSFGNSIFINRHLHSEKELEEIIRHEFVHVKQRHSLDIIWAEILCLINWFNPFAWMLRRSIRQNLEFIADHKVLENGINRKEYQYLLLKVIGHNQYSIATQFNFSSLKKRIAMMNKLKSAKVNLLRFLFLLPVAVVMLLAFRSKYDNRFLPAGRNIVQDTLPVKPKLPDAILSIGLFQSQEDAGTSDPIKQKLQGLVGVKRKDGRIETYDLDSKGHRDDFEKKYGVKLEDLIPPPPPTPAPVTVPQVTTLNSKGYYIDIIDKNGNCVAVVKDKNRKEVERILLDKWKEESDKYENLYGEILPPPTPASSTTPPTPLTAPVPVSQVRPGQSTTAITPAAQTNSKEINLSGISREYEITDKKAELKLLDGTIEKYDLTNKKEKAAFENKYGKIYPLPSQEQWIRAANPAVRTVNINNNKAEIILKNGQKENYDLSDKKEKEAFEKKYGKIINVNTNVNASVDLAPLAVIVDGKTMTSTVAPVTIAAAPLETAVIAPSKITGNLSATSVTPSAIRSAVSGTTVIAPMAATEGVTIIDDYGHTITGNEDILVTITKNTTRQQLDDFIKQMKAKDIELTYDEIEYNSKGQLVSISGTMKSKDGRSNFVATEFEKLILAMIRKGEKTWFKVSVKDKEVI